MGESWTPGSGKKAAHPNARFTAPAAQCPVIDPAWENPKGVPISAILFGGRRASVVPLVHEAFSWQHGTFLGSIMSSEMTAAAAGGVGQLRRDPMAMLPFCGYNMGEYFAHWLRVGAKTTPDKLPRIFYVNWFRKSPDGKFLWPGYGENIRVLKWVIERISGSDKAVKTPIGYLPTPEALDISGLNLSAENLRELLSVRNEDWQKEIPLIREHFAQFGDRLPAALNEEVGALEKRLAGA
jgi:phosphoenolpyruvate carboxykinase (GTP)